MASKITKEQEKIIRRAANAAWQGIAPDAVGYDSDGQGALEWVEQVVWNMEQDPCIDAETLTRLKKFDPAVVKIVKSELEKFG